MRTRGEVVKKSENFADVINGSSHRELWTPHLTLAPFKKVTMYKVSQRLADLPFVDELLRDCAMEPTCYAN